MLRFSVLGQSCIPLAILCACNAAPPAQTVEPSIETKIQPTAAESETGSADDTIHTDAAQSLNDLYASVVAAEDRSEADRLLDEGRQPEKMLAFYSIEPKMKVAELAAGGGYTAELLRRVVGPEGKIYGQNSPFILERFAEEPWTERLKKPIMAGVERIDSEMDAPLPGHDGDLDAVFLVLFYHDTVWFKTNRERMNAAVYAAIKPGGIYALVDHSARAGDGVSVAKTLHRIEEKTVIEEVTKAGFVLEKSGDFLRNPGDERDWSASPSQAGDLRGTSDRFVLLFRKPKESTTAKTQTQSQEPKGAQIACSEPRQAKCTREYRPVCATVDTGVRCIKAPCPSTTQKTFANACVACAEPEVKSYVAQACPGQALPK